jgi:hypothetical protein
MLMRLPVPPLPSLAALPADGGQPAAQAPFAYFMPHPGACVHVLTPSIAYQYSFT